jgi:ubiquinone/menaquinone biosynthesis C-methylase UbiE
MSDELVLSIAAWSSGVVHELAFWSSWLQTSGLSWPASYTQRLSPDTEIDPALGAMLEQVGNGATILDVGAGPVTALGKKWKQCEFSIRAVDPLAGLYDALLEMNGVIPIVRTEFAVAEELSTFFAPASFDIVHCRNALDHSFDPLRGLIEMLRVAKVGGTVMLRHNRNEAENEKYAGFHQFNLDARDGTFVIWNRSAEIVVADRLPIEAEITTEFQEAELLVYIHKKSEFTDTLSVDRLRDRVKSIISGTLSHFIRAELAKLA